MNETIDNCRIFTISRYYLMLLDKLFDEKASDPALMSRPPALELWMPPPIPPGK